MDQQGISSISGVGQVIEDEVRKFSRAPIQTPTLPDSVKVGYRVFKIEEWHPHVAQGIQRYGECDLLMNIIRIDTQYGRVRSANTLLHEILHACFRTGSLEDNDKEERIVSILGDFLSAVWIDNHDVMCWIDQALLSGEHRA